MKEFKVQLAKEESTYVERLWYEYNASLNIIRFLMSQEGVLEQHLQKYLDSSEEKFTALEIAKNRVSKEHKTSGISGSYDYRFDFDDECLIYQEKENEEEN